MRLFSATALSLLLASPMALAQTGAPAAIAAPPSAAALQLAGKLYDDTHTETVFDSMAGNLVQNELAAARNLAGARGATCPGLQPTAKAFVQRVQPLLGGLADAQFRQSAVTIYATALTETELRDVTSFMESASGKKWTAVSPQISQQILVLASDKAKIREPQIQSAMGDFETSFKTALSACPAGTGQAPPPAPPPAKRKK